MYAVGVILVILLVSVRTNIVHIEPSLTSLYYKDKVASFLAKVAKGGEPFNVSFSTFLGEDQGYRYLFDYYQLEYLGNPELSLVRILVPPDDKESTFVFGYTGIHFPPGWVDNNWLKAP